MKSKPFGEFCISSIVFAELIHGAKQSPNPAKHITATVNFCTKLKVVDFDQRAAKTFGDVRLQLEREGLPIGAYDIDAISSRTGKFPADWQSRLPNGSAYTPIGITIALVMLVISFFLLLTINLLQRWSSQRIGHS